MLRYAQHDRSESIIANALFCHSERSEESIVDASLRLRSVQHDKKGKCAPFVMTDCEAVDASMHCVQNRAFAKKRHNRLTTPLSNLQRGEETTGVPQRRSVSLALPILNGL